MDFWLCTAGLLYRLSRGYHYHDCSVLKDIIVERSDKVSAYISLYVHFPSTISLERPPRGPITSMWILNKTSIERN